MQERVLRVLEYEKMKKQLVEHVASSLGRQKVLQLRPSTHIDEIIIWQEQTYEGTKVIRLKGRAPLGGIYDIKSSLKRAAIGGMLNASELLEIASTIYGGRTFKKFIETMAEEGTELPHFAESVGKIIPYSDLERSIKQCIDDHGEVLDHASPALRTVRQQMKSLESGIRSKLDNITRSSQKMLSDAIITIRNDRFVVPVKQEYRHSFPGIVHDQSSSGATLFIEPQAVVLMNNQLRESRVKEAEEIERILKQLSSEVAEHAEQLLANVEILAEIDFTFAKALYSNQMKASQPSLNTEGKITLYKARHPLISGHEVVPIDMNLGNEFSSLIITGPNTGGKTVTLKTAGLLTLMAQSGLHIPAEEGSEMAVFQSVYADIGDEQSIEQSLSTFSSHMTNIVSILEQANHDSLILFDELGAGTDPTEGAALAISILDDVLLRGARVIATTHYSELKAYAYNRKGVMNASVEFDVETLRPTYRLLIGVPGRSNAFAISRRLGLEESIIERAKSQINSENNQLERMIVSLEESRKSSEEEWEETKQLRKEAEALRNDLERQLQLFEEEKDAALAKAEKQAEEAVKKAKQEAEEVIKGLKLLQKDNQAIKEHEFIEARKRLEEASPTLRTKKKKIEKANKAKEMKEGDEVKVISFGQKGFILEKISEDEFQVQIGIMKMKVAKDDLQLIGTPKNQTVTKPVATVRGSDFHVKPELDLRGERFEDAMLKVEKYIDDALLAGYHQVSIIHGKGTGALRKGVKELLKSHRHVKQARDAAMNEGGLGNTVVELK